MSPPVAHASAVFLFAGEGAHSAGPDLSMLRTSPSYTVIDDTLKAQHGQSVDAFLEKNLGDHTAPFSPVVTTILNILQADLWRMWGHGPAYALGHSVGELAAAYVSGIIDVPTALRIAYENGVVAASLQGKMLHTTLPAGERRAPQTRAALQAGSLACLTTPRPSASREYTLVHTTRAAARCARATLLAHDGCLHSRLQTSSRCCRTASATSRPSIAASSAPTR